MNIWYQIEARDGNGHWRTNGIWTQSLDLLSALLDAYDASGNETRIVVLERP